MCEVQTVTTIQIGFDAILLRKDSEQVERKNNGDEEGSSIEDAERIE